LGDAIYANGIILGAAWQAGSIPLSYEAIQQAIRLNGAGVEGTQKAFELGRLVVHDVDAVQKMLNPIPNNALGQKSLQEIIEKRAKFLTDYQNEKYAERYISQIDKLAKIDDKLAEIAAKYYFKLLTYKDEYEVARLHSEYLPAQIAENFDGVTKINFHLAWIVTIKILRMRLLRYQKKSAGLAM